MSASGDAYLKESEAADYSKLSGRTLQRMRQDGTGPSFVTVRSRILYRRADIDAWLASKLVSSTSHATVLADKAA